MKHRSNTYVERGESQWTLFVIGRCTSCGDVSEGVFDWCSRCKTAPSHPGQNRSPSAGVGMRTRFGGDPCTIHDIRYHGRYGSVN